MFSLHVIADALDTRIEIHLVDRIAGFETACSHWTTVSGFLCIVHQLLEVEDTGGLISLQVHTSKLWSTFALTQKTLECVGLPLACQQ